LTNSNLKRKPRSRPATWQVLLEAPQRSNEWAVGVEVLIISRIRPSQDVLGKFGRVYAKRAIIEHDIWNESDSFYLFTILSSAFCC
jgi:hypothetical protein